MGGSGVASTSVEPPGGRRTLVALEVPVLVFRGIRQSHPDDYGCAQRVRYLIEMGGAHLTEDEVLYLALHVARVTTRTSAGTG